MVSSAGAGTLGGNTAMQRDEWKFSYNGKQLTDAAKAKVAHHQRKFDWWRKRKDELLVQIKSEGLEITEAQSLIHSGHKAGDWRNGAKVMVRNDLQCQLDECLRKLGFHTEELDGFGGWVQVLEANPESVLPLDHEDWLYFFGRDQ
jgi:hypothetical protein